MIIDYNFSLLETDAKTNTENYTRSNWTISLAGIWLMYVSDMTAVFQIKLPRACPGVKIIGLQQRENSAQKPRRGLRAGLCAPGGGMGNPWRLTCCGSQAIIRKTLPRTIVVLGKIPRSSHVKKHCCGAR